MAKFAQLLGSTGIRYQLTWGSVCAFISMDVGSCCVWDLSVPMERTRGKRKGVDGWKGLWHSHAPGSEAEQCENRHRLRAGTWWLQMVSGGCAGRTGQHLGLTVEPNVTHRPPPPTNLPRQFKTLAVGPEVRSIRVQLSALGTSTLSRLFTLGQYLPNAHLVVEIT